MGTPASPPKPRRKSPGWKKGQVRRKRQRYPIVKKGKRKFTKNLLSFSVYYPKQVILDRRDLRGAFFSVS